MERIPISGIRKKICVCQPRLHRFEVRCDVAACLVLALKLGDDIHQEVVSPPATLFSSCMRNQFFRVLDSPLAAYGPEAPKVDIGSYLRPSG